jgi:hypothetical protein
MRETPGLLSSNRHPTRRPLRRVFAVVALVLAATACMAFAERGFAGYEGRCTSAEKLRYQAAATLYARHMAQDRARYFRVHKSGKLRAAFVKKQNAKLRALRLKANCDDSAPPEPLPPKIDLNPAPSANELFVFGPEMPADAQQLIKGDIAFAAEDEARLVGLSLDKVTVFASTDANWLAGKQCGVFGAGGDCVSATAAFYSSGNSTAQGGPAAVFIYWAASAWSGDAATKQKIIAHELFHALQYQTHHLVGAARTPFDQIRATGPVWLDEGAPEMVGFRVMADRLLGSYAVALGNQSAVTKRIDTPLNQLERLSQTNIPSVYSLFALSVDHLLKSTPSGVPALAGYYRALGTGAAWPEAFKQAFGMSVGDYYANFADYRARL